jgi:hypothetical protein
VLEPKLASARVIVAKGCAIDPVPAVSLPPSFAVATNTLFASVMQPFWEGGAPGVHGPASGVELSDASSDISPSSVALSVAPSLSRSAFAPSSS